MRLYLVQHGEAKPESEDPERPLTDRGRDDVARVAVFAQRAGVEVFEIQHSGKRRAAETAAILAEHLAPRGGVGALQGLAPRDDVGRVAELIHQESAPRMFVGHLPFMARLASLLVTGASADSVVGFQMGGIVCLERDPTSRAWMVRWIVTPDLVP